VFEDIHVVTNGKKDRWLVQEEGATEPLGEFDSQEEAVNSARETAARNLVELLVHDADGRVRDRDSWGHDPFDM
jgi:hypothetical protein